MDYGLLPPEINSTRLYAGPGSAPMRAAAQAWDTLSRGLYSTAAEFGCATGTMVWTGPSAEAMRASAATYTAWMTATAGLANDTANQARAAVVAFETALAVTVPPSVVAANRALQQALVATNVLGLNAAAIAAAEAQYGKMWAQDAAAMYEYAASSATATQSLAQFAFPQTLAGPMQSILAELLTSSGTTTDLFNSWGQALISSAPYDVPLGILSLFSTLWALDSPGSPLLQAINGFAQAEATGGSAAPAAAAAVSAPTVSVRVGAARQLGPLSIPPSWAMPARPLITPRAGPAIASAVDAEPFPVPLPLGAPGARSQQQSRRPDPEYGTVPRFMTRPPSGG